MLFNRRFPAGVDHYDTLVADIENPFFEEADGSRMIFSAGSRAITKRILILMKRVEKQLLH